MKWQRRHPLLLEIGVLVPPAEPDRLQVKVPYIGQQGNGSRTLDGMGQCPLMFGTGARNSPRYDLSPFGGEILERSRIFVIDYKALVCTESAHFTPVKNSFFLSSGAGF
jgi:hypothetical protein